MTTRTIAYGLTSAEARQRLDTDGPNAVAPPPPRTVWRRIGGQLTDPLVALLLAAGVVTAVLGDLPDTIIILLVVVVNTVIGVVQEVRADAAIAALDRMAAPAARVVRDGTDHVVPAAELVRGDHVLLEAGDVVPADLELVEARQATFDESALTGESVPVHHDAGDTAGAGTILAAGRAAGTVTATGTSSALGRIAELVAGTRPGPTPLQRRIAALGRILGAAAVVVSALVFTVGVLTGQPVTQMGITAVSLVVAAVPESLPAVVTLALALGARRMARTSAIPRRLHAVETLGSVTVIASDKTGTLTENRMTVQRAITAGGHRSTVSGSGYDPEGTIDGDTIAGLPVVGDTSSLRELARAGALCNDAALLAPDGDRTGWAAAGDPMEAALLTFAHRCGVDPDAERGTAPRVAEIPFDQDTRRMTTVHRLPSGEFLTVCKGAPEAVLDPASPLLPAAAEFASDGLRVLALATAVSDAPDTRPELEPIGLVGIGDPLRATARDTAEAFERAGVRLILITGDHPRTATAIGDSLGLLADGGTVAEGGVGGTVAEGGVGGTVAEGGVGGTVAEGGVGDTAAARRAGDSAAAGIATTRVYARTRPEQKLDIIRALQDRGEIVAMTGDGVNDAPALRRADIGVAMGSGTEVARQAAELVLVDDNLGTVATAIGEGRRIYDNIRRFLRYALSGGAAELVVMLLGPLFGMPVALLPAQLLWINLLTHGVPGVALGAEPAEAGVLTRRPRSPQESVLGAGLLRAVVAGALLLATVTMAAGVVAMHADRPWQSVMFLVLGLSQLGVALAVRAHPKPGTPRNGALLAAVAVCALLQVAGVMFEPLRALLGTEPLDAVTILACCAVALVPGALLRLAGNRP